MSADERRGLYSAKKWSRVGLASGVALLAFCPAALATNRSTAAYVLDSSQNNVLQYTVGADGTLKADSPKSVATGAGPYSLALSSDGKSAYVANSASGEFAPNVWTVSQFDVGANGALTPKSPETVATGIFPEYAGCPRQRRHGHLDL